MYSFDLSGHFKAITFCLSLFLTACSPNNQQSQILESTPAEYTQAIIKTDLGSIKIELYPEKAPVTVANFVRYIESDAFNNGQFYRVVRLDNDNGSPKIEVIQGSANRDFNDFEPISLETTEQTGIKHLDGVLSMARGAPNTATHEFFICIGAQPSLDFGGKRNPDGQGFAAFGKVIEGMEIVNKIHQIRDAKEVEDAYVKGQILAKPAAILDIEIIKS